MVPPTSISDYYCLIKRTVRATIITSSASLIIVIKILIAVANENAKIVVAELLTATVQAIDPEYTVVVVQ